MTKDRGRRTEDRGQRTEDRGGLTARGTRTDRQSRAKGDSGTWRNAAVADRPRGNALVRQPAHSAQGRTHRRAHDCRDRPEPAPARLVDAAVEGVTQCACI